MERVHESQPIHVNLSKGGGNLYLFAAHGFAPLATRNPARNDTFEV
jgi:hypothetical protein